MKQKLLLAFALFGLNSFGQTNMTIGSTTVQVDTIISGIDIPWEIIYGPDDHIWMTERKGIVSRVNPATGVKTIILDIEGPVHQQSESGLLGMALHPNFPATPEVFLAYTYSSSGIKEKIVKYTYNGTNLVNEQILIDNITGNSTHIGCRLFMLPDNTMLATTGDAQNPGLAQDLASLSGKILRMNLDGTVPADNPISGSYVYSWGHRNTQGLAAGPNGMIYMSEHGASSDDEFQIVEPNRNYGWPNVEGLCDEPTEVTFCTANNVKEPLVVWTPTIATSDLLYYENVLFPEFHQKMLMTVLKDKELIALELNAAGDAVVNQETYLTSMFGRLRDLCVGPDKEIYLATNGQSWSNTSPNTHSIIVLRTPNNVGLSQMTLENLVKAYPNPMKNTLKVEISKELIGSLAVITDISGKVVMTFTLDSLTSEISVERVVSGMYNLLITDASGNSFVKKLIK